MSICTLLEYYFWEIFLLSLHYIWRTNIVLFTPLHFYWCSRYLLLLSLRQLIFFFFFCKILRKINVLLICIWFVLVVLPYLYHVVPYKEIKKLPLSRSYLKPMIEIFVTKTDHGLQKLVFQPEKVCRGKVATTVSELNVC